MIQNLINGTYLNNFHVPVILLSLLIVSSSCVKTCQNYADELRDKPQKEYCTGRPLHCIISGEGIGYCNPYLYFGWKPHLIEENGFVRKYWQLCKVDFNSIENFPKDLFVQYNEITKTIEKGAAVSVYNPKTGTGTGRIYIGDLVTQTSNNNNNWMISVEVAKKLLNSKVYPVTNEKFSTSVYGGVGIEQIVLYDENYIQFKNYAIAFDLNNSSNCLATLSCIWASDFWKAKFNSCDGSGYGFNCDSYNINEPMNPNNLQTNLSSVYGSEVIYPMHVVEPEQKIGSKRIHYLIDKNRDKQYGPGVRVMSTTLISRYIYIIVDFNKIGNINSSQNYSITFGPKGSSSLQKVDASFQNGRIRYCGKGKMVVRFDLTEEGDMEAALYHPDGTTKLGSCDIFVSAVDAKGNSTREINLLPLTVNNLANPKSLRTSHTFDFEDVLKEIGKHNEGQVYDNQTIKQIWKVNFLKEENASLNISGVGKFVDNSGNLKITTDDLERIRLDDNSKLSGGLTVDEYKKILSEAGISSTYSRIYNNYFSKYKSKNTKKGIIMYVNDIELVSGDYNSEVPAAGWASPIKSTINYTQIKNSLIDYGRTGPSVLNSAYNPDNAVYCSVAIVYKKKLNELIPTGSSMIEDNIAAMAMGHEILHMWDNNKMMGSGTSKTISDMHNAFHNGKGSDKCIFGYYSPRATWASIFEDWNKNGIILCEGHSEILKMLFSPNE